jgi:aerotaxis receptor
MDKNGIIISANESMSQMSGYNLQDLIGKDYKILLHPDIVKTVWKDVVNTVANGQCWFGYLKKMARDGHSYWAHMVITPLHSKVTFQSICRKAYNEEIKVLNLAI